MTDTLNSIPEKRAHENIEAITAKVHTAIDRAATIAGDGEQRMQNVAKELRRQADSLSSKAADKHASLGRKVQSEPAKSFGVAFGVGAACAWLLTRK